MKQRTFPWLQMLDAPKDAPMQTVSRLRQEHHALAVSIKAKCGGYSDAWFAFRMGVSRSYFCELKRGTKSIPKWFVDPFCALTGTNLLKQYRLLQEAMRAASAKRTLGDELANLADELRRAA